MTLTEPLLLPLTRFVTDLGFVFTPSPSPNFHIESILYFLGPSTPLVSSNALRLNFIQLILWMFFTQAFVKHIIYHGFFIWDPHTVSNLIQLERVQCTFLNFAIHTPNIKCHPRDYAPVLVHLGPESLDSWRHTANIYFLRKLLSRQIDSPYLPFQISFKFILVRHASM